MLLTHTKPDGTRVTDFPNSLAAFAKTTGKQRTSDPEAYNAAVEAAVRQGVEQTKDCVDKPAAAAAPKMLTHYSVDTATKRMIDIYRPCAFEEFASRAGLKFEIPQCPN